MHTRIPPARPRGNSAAEADDERLDAFRRYLAALDARDFREATRQAHRLRQFGLSVVTLESRRPGP